MVGTTVIGPSNSRKVGQSTKQLARALSLRTIGATKNAGAGLKHSKFRRGVDVAYKLRENLKGKKQGIGQPLTKLSCRAMGGKACPKGM